MDAYKLFVRKNSEFVRSLESLASGVTWLIPERFSNSEIAPEAVHAILGIISSINQHIIDTAPTQGHPWLSKNYSHPWPLLVSILKDAEGVVEVAAAQFVGEKRKWSFLAITEAVKVVVRLAAFRESGYKMLLLGGEVTNEEKSLDVRGGHHDGIRSNGMPVSYAMNGHAQNGNGFMPSSLEGRAMAALSRFGENARMISDPMWMNRLQHIPEPPAMEVKRPTLSSIWWEKGFSGRLFLIGEVIHILRPLLYVLLIRKYGIRSWTPWLVSLAAELTSLGIQSHCTGRQHKGEGSQNQLSDSEKEELRRRKLIWAFYVLRDPFFTKFTRHHLERAEKTMNPVPFIGFLTSKLVDLLVGAQTRYTYTSCS